MAEPSLLWCFRFEQVKVNKVESCSLSDRARAPCDAACVRESLAILRVCACVQMGWDIASTVIVGETAPTLAPVCSMQQSLFVSRACPLFPCVMAHPLPRCRCFSLAALSAAATHDLRSSAEYI